MPHTTPHRSRSRISSLLSLSTLSTLLLTFSSPSAAFDCKDIVAGGKHFHLGALSGPHLAHWLDEPNIEFQTQHNYTFTVDVCEKLKHKTGAPKDTECHPGTRICALREDIDLSGAGNHTIHPIEIAGTYTTNNGRKIDAQFELLRDSKSNSDAGREGFRAELHGGRYPFNDNKAGIDQRAIIEFVCDKERTGLEGDEKDGEKQEGDEEEKEKRRKRDSLGRRDAGKCEDSDKSLRFCGYKLEDLPKDKKVKTLRLEWRTKHACEDAQDDTSGSASSHWGFFTWFIIILFLATAAYLIFGSWLNYNRYGARGWDLLPHGDTIRDIPYLLREWGRGIVGSLQGGGSRGGYSAV